MLKGRLAGARLPIWALPAPLISFPFVSGPGPDTPELPEHQRHHTERGEPDVANIKSQIKRNRQNEAAHERNKSVKSALKTAVRKFREAAEGGNAEEARTLAVDAGKQLDKAASKGVIHKNQAANRKSAIQKKVASL
jgi:small subunit ribosomal protein S20